MHKAGKIALGCLLAPVGIFAVTIFFFATLRMAGMPEPNPRQSSLRQDLPVTETELIQSPSGDDSLDELRFDPEGTVDVTLDLEEGFFEIVPGPADEGIRVDADYDEGSYDLAQDYGRKGDRPSYRLDFKSRVSFWRRIAQDGSFSDEDMAKNQLTIQLPRDTPMMLHLKIAKSDCTVDLSGLALVGLEADLGVGEFDVEIEDYNPTTMAAALFRTKMGEFDVSGLAYLRARTIHIEGSMGEMAYDFGGEILDDTELISRARMGEMRLRLPEGAKWDPDSSARATWGEAPPMFENPGEPDPSAPLLSLDCRVFMGELTYDSYRPRPTRIRDRDRE